MNVADITAQLADANVVGEATEPLLRIHDLVVTYRTGVALTPALRGLSLSLLPGEVLGIVGETGSGKTTLAHTLMGLLPPGAARGSVDFANGELPINDEDAMQSFRWRRIALVFQTATTGFDPVYRVGAQVAEPLVTHRGMAEPHARRRAKQVWEEVGLPADRFDHYPHELSGGEKRLAMLAMALACDPELLLLDEPTANLDALTRNRVLALLRRLRRERGLAMILITHSLGDLVGTADRALVMYAGRAVEEGPVEEVLAKPRHPYTWGLVNAFPSMVRAKDLWAIRGEPPDSASVPAGCAFAPRCTQAVAECSRDLPELLPHGGRLVACHLGGVQTLLDVRGLSKTFPERDGPGVGAVRQASLRLQEGEVVALVGQTGSGKTTLAHLVVGLLEPDAGEVFVQGRPMAELRRQDGRGVCRRLQLVSQDPFDALSPRLPVLELVREPLDLLDGAALSVRNERAVAALRDVRLPTTPQFLAKRTHELSGGQLQRVAIARALTLRPKVLIADEPVSMLDPSEQARLIRLLKDLQNDYGMGLLIISHDIALVRKVADRIVVMNAGQVVEDGTAEQVIGCPTSPYTRGLLAAVAGAGGEWEHRANGQPAAPGDQD